MKTKGGRGRAEQEKAAGPSLSALESHLGFWLRFVSNHVSGEFRRLVEAQGVSVSEWVALRQIFDDGDSSATRLQQALGMTKGAISKILARLEARGLLQRSCSEGDRRAQCVALTRAGRQLVPRLTALADQNDSHFFGHLSLEERERLEALLKEMVRRNNWQQFPVE